jgi:hypothetical protein
VGIGLGDRGLVAETRGVDGAGVELESSGGLLVEGEASGTGIDNVGEGAGAVAA